MQRCLKSEHEEGSKQSVSCNVVSLLSFPLLISPSFSMPPRPVGPVPGYPYQVPSEGLRCYMRRSGLYLWLDSASKEVA
eukprot:1687259-Rhodomonas_salina.3